MSEKKTARSLSDLHSLLTGEEAPVPEETRPKKDPFRSLITLHVLFEKAGRKGSGVTLTRGFHHTENDLLRFAKELKALCGAGGTVKGAEIEIQGDHRTKVAAYFEKLGLKVKVRK